MKVKGKLLSGLFWAYKIPLHMTLVVLSTKKFGNQTPVGDKERVNINKRRCNSV